MKAYILPSNKKIEPFNESPDKYLIANQPLREAQKEILQSEGLESILLTSENQNIDDAEEYIVLADNVFFTQKLLRKFVLNSRKQKKCAVCALRKGLIPTRTVITTQDVVSGLDYFEYNLRYLPEKRFRTNDYHPVIFNGSSYYAGFSVPKHIYSSGEYEIPVVEELIVQIDCWTNLWSVNLALLLVRLAELLDSRSKLFFLAIRSLSFNKWKMLRKFNQIGKKSDIHPTAYIEESIIGNNVTIGAGAVIRGSIIGNDTFVGNGVIIERSVIGNKNTILSGHIMYSVLESGVFTIAQLITASLIGRDVFLGSGVILTDFRLDGKNIIVMKDGEKIDTGNTFIGCCLGHDVYLGASCIIAPGRMIPNEMRILPDKSRIITCASDQNLSGFRILNPKRGITHIA